MGFGSVGDPDAAERTTDTVLDALERLGARDVETAAEILEVVLERARAG